MQCFSSQKVKMNISKLICCRYLIIKNIGYRCSEIQEKPGSLCRHHPDWPHLWNSPLDYFVSINHRPVLRSRDQSGPIRGQHWGHVTSLDQSEASQTKYSPQSNLSSPYNSLLQLSYLKILCVVCHGIINKRISQHCHRYV